MANLEETLRTVANEYARLTAKLLGANRYDWVGEDTYGLCTFDDNTCLTLEEMQIIIDNLDHWVSIYGTRDKVADTILEWQQWWQDGEEKIVDVKTSAVHEYFFPNINLRSWLMGLRETKQMHSVCDSKLRFQMADIMANEYGINTRIGDILNGTRDEYNKAKADNDKANAELREQLANGTAPEKMQRAYDEFKEVLDNNE